MIFIILIDTDNVLLLLLFLFTNVVFSHRTSSTSNVVNKPIIIIVISKCYNSIVMTEERRIYINITLVLIQCIILCIYYIKKSVWSNLCNNVVSINKYLGARENVETLKRTVYINNIIYNECKIIEKKIF